MKAIKKERQKVTRIRWA